jgi:Protein of unknown function (DUF3089)
MFHYKSLILLCLFASCVSKKPIGTYESQTRPTAPDYSKTENWAALPDKIDAADGWAGNIVPQYKGEEVDVFFLYPTIYTGSKSYQTQWNAPIDLEKFNKAVDNSPIKYQASLFNGVGRVYAPRYRQAHIKSYFTKDTASARKAFALAYEDVKTAFQYYLDHYNQGRPIIIASHSQGTTHAAHLLKEFFDNTNLKNRLVVAYIVGIPIPKGFLKNIPICENENQTTCYCSWRTFHTGHQPKKSALGNHIAVVNPLTWKTDETYAPASLNKGSVFVDFTKVKVGGNDAQIHNGLLWTNKPKFKGSFLMRTHNYHAGDFNIYYMNVRENAKHRIGLYWK